MAQAGTPDPKHSVRSFSASLPSAVPSRGEAVLTWDIRPSGLRRKIRRRHAPPSPSYEPVTVLDPCTEFAAIYECRYPRSLWCIRRGRKIPGHPLIRQSAGCAHITRRLHPVARRRDHRLPSSKRAVSIQILWCTLNACMSMVGLH